jgi:hypothetical protein
VSEITAFKISPMVLRLLVDNLSTDWISFKIEADGYRDFEKIRAKCCQFLANCSEKEIKKEHKLWFHNIE